jgi:hypothetical protein
MKLYEKSYLIYQDLSQCRDSEVCVVSYCSNNEIVDSNATWEANICEYVKMCFMSVYPVTCTNQAANVRIKHTVNYQTKMYGEVQEKR